MSETGVSRADIASLASLSKHYTAVAAAAKAAHLTNNLFRIGTGQVVESNNVAVASLASVSSHYTAVAAAANAAHLGNNLFRTGTGQVVESNTVAVASLASLSSHYTAVAAAAKAAHSWTVLFKDARDEIVSSTPAALTSLADLATNFAAVATAAAASAEAIVAARIATDTPPSLANAPGAPRGANDRVLEEGWNIVGGAVGGLTGGYVDSNQVSRLGLQLSALSDKYVPDLFDREVWKSLAGDLKDHVADPVIDTFKGLGSELIESWNRPIPPDLQNRLDNELIGTGYGLGLGFVESNRSQDVGSTIQIDVNLDGNVLDKRFVTREDLAEAQAAGRAKVRLDGRR